MSTVTVYTPDLSIFSLNRMRNRRKVDTISPSLTMAMDSKSSQIRIKDELSLEFTAPPIPQLEILRQSGLQFDRLQQSEQKFNRKKIEGGKFVVREVVLDEEYWTAAWLRAETHWEDRPNDRYADSLKRKYADEEFNALKRLCKSQHGQKCACIVTVKKEENNVKDTVLKSVGGTLDLSIRYLLHGETFPGELAKAPFFCGIDRRDPSRYGYISNLCVAKSARRQGIASLMLHFAVESARIDGVQQVFVHVFRKNEPAQELYLKLGFEIVETASSQLIKEQTYLLRIKT